MGKLDGRVALVTGAARGMGAATARVFAEEGAALVLADLLDAEGEALARQLGPTASYLHHDVSDEASWQRLVDHALARHGRIDALVNNAGILMFSTLLDMPKGDFEKVLAVNLVGTFLGMKTVAPVMVRQGKGAIVNISSSDGLRGANGIGAYSASKWGVRDLTKVAAMELGPKGVRVNSVHPGGINTPMINLTGASEAEMDQRFPGVPLPRAGRPEEIARTSLFLASDDASYINGAELAVDGGATAGVYYPGVPGAPGS